jgi:hypothetical protein
MRKFQFFPYAAGLVVLMLSFFPVAVEAGHDSDVKSFTRFPVPLYDENGDATGNVILSNNAPNPRQLTVLGWWPDQKLLLVQLRPGDKFPVYISYGSLAMEDTALWETRMHATGDLICVDAPVGSRLRADDANRRTSGSKGFRSPC